MDVYYLLLSKAPVGDSPEAVQYWEAKLSGIESALTSLAGIIDNFDHLPQAVQEQFKGLFAGIRQQSEAAGSERVVLEGDYKVALISDLHMYEGFKVGREEVIDPATGKNERLLDIHNIFTDMVDKIIAAGCRCCLITEPYETACPTPNETAFFQYNTMRLAEYMPVIIEPGNHGISKNPKDASALESMKGRDNVYVVERPTILYQEGLTLNDKPSGTWPQRDCAKIFVLPFPSKAIINGQGEGKTIEELTQLVSAKLKLQLKKWRLELDPAVPNILLAHITVEGAIGAENPDIVKYNPCLHPDDLAGFDFVGLGHLHFHQYVSENGLYGGSPERFDFNDEGNQKGFVIATFKGENKELDIEFIETAAREFCTLDPQFFDNENWQGTLQPRTIYRIKGEVSKEEYEALHPKLAAFPYPLLNKLSVKRTIRVRDERISDDVAEIDALKAYLESNLDMTPDLAEIILKQYGELMESPELLAAA